MKPLRSEKRLLSFLSYWPGHNLVQRSLACTNERRWSRNWSAVWSRMPLNRCLSLAWYGSQELLCAGRTSRLDTARHATNTARSRVSRLCRSFESRWSGRCAGVTDRRPAYGKGPCRWARPTWTFRHRSRSSRPFVVSTRALSAATRAARG